MEAEPELAEVEAEGYHGIYFSYKDFQSLHTVMAGRNQIGNAAVALEVICMLRKGGYKIPGDAVKRGMERTQWPGRFSCIGEAPAFILDGAHNEDAALKLRESVETYFPGRKRIGIMGVFRDKEYERIAEIMGPILSVIYAVDLPDEKRGLPAGKLAAVLGKYCPCVKRPDGYGQSAGVDSAVKAALFESEKDDVILAFGSLSYLHQVKEAYDKSCMVKEKGKEK